MVVFSYIEHLYNSFPFFPIFFLFFLLRRRSDFRLSRSVTSSRQNRLYLLQIETNCGGGPKILICNNKPGFDGLTVTERDKPTKTTTKVPVPFVVVLGGVGG